MPVLAPPAPQDVQAAVAVAREAAEAWVRFDFDRLFSLMSPQSALLAGAKGRTNYVFSTFDRHRDRSDVLGRKPLRGFHPVRGMPLGEARSIVGRTAAPDAVAALTADPAALARSAIFLHYDVEGRSFLDVLVRDGAGWKLLTQPCDVRFSSL